MIYRQRLGCVVAGHQAFNRVIKILPKFNHLSGSEIAFDCACMQVGVAVLGVNRCGRVSDLASMLMLRCLANSCPELTTPEIVAKQFGRGKFLQIGCHPTEGYAKGSC